MEEKPDAPQTENIVVGKRVPKYKRFIKKYKLPLIVIVVVALVGAGVWWLFASGHLKYVGSGSSIVCGSDMVSKYNGAMLLQPRDGSSESTIDIAGLKKMASEIKNKSGYADDPTCQTILFWSAVQNDDYKAANSAYQALQKLHDKGKFADSDMRNLGPLITYKMYMDGLTGSGVTQQGSIGG